ncbi:MAG TPA: 6-bladed beta-propeller [Acidobacteriaceae bacterium]|jgi:DNA-binding beta-propeller fold protein YncE|nr:6-bladed beta-propeller [Acidobacteriaceae bacterium]
MVQFLLSGARRSTFSALLFLAGIALAPVTAGASGPASPDTRHPPPERWQMSLDGGRTLTWERSFSSESEVKPNRGFWNKVVDVIAGAPDYHSMIRPYSVAEDSHGRIIVTDPGAAGVHIFDFDRQKYKFLQHLGKPLPMLSPQCVAVDAADNLYVTDSDAGAIFVFEASGKFVRSIGALKGGEGYFKRPTGIAVDSAAQRIYVTDTLRDKLFVLDMQGNIVGSIGQRGEGNGEFNYPTELRLDGPNLMVVDAMNFRVQAFDRSGKFQYAIGKIGDSPGAMFRPKATGTDSEGDLYIVDALWGVVQVFNPQGQLLYYFGVHGSHAGEFQLPTGLFIDRSDRVFVVDSFNRRVQVFRYAGLRSAAGATK